jgi:hypothetical protein
MIVMMIVMMVVMVMAVVVAAHVGFPWFGTVGRSAATSQ